MGTLRGAVGFLTRIPVSADGDDWDAFARAPWAFPVVGWLVGGLAALALFVPTLGVPFAYLVALVLVTGVNHFDGLADLGDAMVVHGDSERRRAVLKDSEVGVGAVLALGVALVGLALAGLGLARLPLRTGVTVVLASEVGAKLAMAALACTGRASHEGFASAFTEQCDPTDMVGPLVVAVPAVGLAAFGGLAVPAALAAPPAVAWWLRRWADEKLGGVNGDVFGATNELGRLAGLYAGLLLV
ncbi:adenosylcobinamide-GDP ribazoletransferase [Halosegnis rubeus]|jgi:adenosylcobinamide-GDP ribazoletransferase|uniref:Adenosylcobinamide-GDP ribazoletransferase n=1 Tax=Halosegnis rubeus TaxID=2212850 RepID=A0A5N5UMF0_9EURY|nr:adenosylcobinamide-GDP ribazoletransferase [Halosegnis rubeus]KAB7516765.1 adenosylcobinamide-GDP ribazoletransferase [Halosegnis rubeus]KAB7520109.1 adenosylcobinamide-GDP ribazoletransferase [Halosegnis rubeus]